MPYIKFSITIFFDSTIMIDNPKGQKFSFGYRTAGWVVAPIVKQLVTRIAPILGVKPQLESSPNFSNNLLGFSFFFSILKKIIIGENIIMM